MKFKNRYLLLFCAFIMLLSGCAYGNLGVEGLLYAPKVSEEQSLIHKTLIESVGKDIELKYPRMGENRSAFVVANIDNEPTNEAIVFYQKINSTENESTIRINVLDQIDGKWQSVYDLPGVGTEIERIVVSQVGTEKSKYIVIGFNMINKNEKTLQIYNYKEKKLNKIFSDSYSIMDFFDIDQDKTNEVVSITNNVASGNVTAKILKPVNGEIINSSSVTIEDKILSYTGYRKGIISNNTQAIFVDALKENGVIQTEVFYYRYNNLQNSMVDKKSNLMKRTTRPVGYPSCDVDMDGVIEIPVTTAFWGYEIANTEEKMLLTDWYAFDGYFNIKKKYSSYYNLNDAYAFLLPSRWLGAVTVKRDTVTDEMVFYKYDGVMSENMTELMKIRVATKKEQAEIISQGYSLVKSKGQIDYFVKLNNKQSESLVLTMAEVINNFYVL